MSSCEESTDHAIVGQPSVRRHAWWREGEAYVLAALVIAVYFIRAGDLTIRGEESRWATVAREMVRDGDWIVPRQQGEPFLSRPPLGNWLIAGAILLRGECDDWAIRLPTILAVLATTVLVYAFGRTFMSRLGALTAGLAICSMGEVLQMGRVAESDMIFASLLSSAWIVWLWGYRAGWSANLIWIAGYGLAGLAALQKGLQAPVYFAGGVWLYLIVCGEWRKLFRLSHVVGILTFLAVVGAWQIPFFQQQGWEGTKTIWWSDASSRVLLSQPSALLKHLVTYPLEDFGCTLPWSPLLLAFLSRHFRQQLDQSTSVAKFFWVCTLVGFVPCWLSPGAMTRYAMPLYPGLALLCGVVVDRAGGVNWSPRLARAWSIGWRLIVALMVVAPIALWFAPLAPSTVITKYAVPWPVATVFTVASWAAALLIAWGVRTGGSRASRIVAATIAFYVGGTYATVVMDGMVRRSEDTEAAVAQLRAMMPADVRLLSLNGTHHLFAYHYEMPIESCQPIDLARDGTWFSYQSVGRYRWPLPFRHEIIAVISVDRNHLDEPRDVVVVCRTLPSTH